MTPDERVGAVVLILVFGMLLAVALISIAKAQTLHIVSIGPAGADPRICVMDRNDRVACRNDTDRTIELKLPLGSVVGWYVFDFTLAPRETSKAVEWNMDNVDADWEIDGVVVATVRTMDDPPPGSCSPSGRQWRLVVGGIAGD